IERAEDFNLGRVFEIETALNTTSLGGTANQILLDIELGRGYRVSPNGVLFVRHILDARYGADNDDQTLLAFQGTYYNTRFTRQTLVAHMGLDWGIGLDASDRLLLGGDEGLRGFDSRILDGDRRFLLAFEDRVWTRRELFHLFYAGAAAFIDAGNAWGESGGPGGFGQIHADAGVGLRFDASRSAHGGLLRLDLAFPLAGERSGGPAIQFSFGHGLGY
ncbi:MAG: BamA/TamA family outer membrane protein, partial [Vicinamibacteria bacterium]